MGQDATLRNREVDGRRFGSSKVEGRSLGGVRDGGEQARRKSTSYLHLSAHLSLLTLSCFLVLYCVCDGGRDTCAGALTGNFLPSGYVSLLEDRMRGSRAKLPSRRLRSAAAVARREPRHFTVCSGLWNWGSHRFCLGDDRHRRRRIPYSHHPDNALGYGATDCSHHGRLQPHKLLRRIGRCR